MIEAAVAAARRAGRRALARRADRGRPLRPEAACPSSHRRARATPSPRSSGRSASRVSGRRGRGRRPTPDAASGGRRRSSSARCATAACEQVEVNVDGTELRVAPITAGLGAGRARRGPARPRRGGRGEHLRRLGGSVIARRRDADDPVSPELQPAQTNSSESCSSNSAGSRAGSNGSIAWIAATSAARARPHDDDVAGSGACRVPVRVQLSRQARSPTAPALGRHLVVRRPGTRVHPRARTRPRPRCGGGAAGRSAARGSSRRRRSRPRPVRLP